MTLRDASLVLLVLLGARCGGPASPETPAEPGNETSGETAPQDAAAEASSPDAVGEHVLILDAVVGSPVRGRLRYFDMWTYVEACVQEIVAATPEEAAQVRYTLRLCAEDGRTEAIARGWSKEAGRQTLFTDSIYETAQGATSHLYFECPYGTAWEVDATAESVEGDRVRLSVRGEFRSCTK